MLYFLLQYGNSALCIAFALFKYQNLISFRYAFLNECVMIWTFANRGHCGGPVASNGHLKYVVGAASPTFKYALRY